MKCYIVNFETSSSEVNEKVKEKLKLYNGYCPISDNCWAILTDKSAAQIRDSISLVIESGDRIFVLRSGSEGAWKNTYGEKNSKWLKENL